MSVNDQPFCLCADGLRTRGMLWSDVNAMRTEIEDRDAICNLIEGRYGFAVLLLAALANGQTTLLPSSRAEQAVTAALAGYDDPLIVHKPRHLKPGSADIPTNFPGTAHLFTSGSTGAPVAHAKDWRFLVGGSLLASQLVSIVGLQPGRALLVGTSPHQHMYGMEAALFTGIAHHHCIADRSIFYPGDLESIIAEAGVAGLPDVVLVTTPPHLRFLEAEILASPQIRCVISATAPLHVDLARRLENAGDRQVLEIYGSTETGSLAWRRTATGDAWQPLDAFTLAREGEALIANAPHLRSPVALSDDVELHADGRFSLLGRSGDLIQIAGKRQSLGALNAVLATLGTIADSVIIKEQDADGDRLRYYIVPRSDGPSDPKVLARLVRSHMRRYVELVFLPKTVEVVVGDLPRQQTGKISRADLHRLGR